MILQSISVLNDCDMIITARDTVLAAIAECRGGGSFIRWFVCNTATRSSRGVHWVLAFYDDVNNNVTLYDSLSNYNGTKQLSSSIAAFLPCVIKSLGVQRDGNSCGSWCLVMHHVFCTLRQTLPSASTLSEEELSNSIGTVLGITSPWDWCNNNFKIPDE